MGQLSLSRIFPAYISPIFVLPSPCYFASLHCLSSGPLPAQVAYEEGLERQRNTKGITQLVQDSVARVVFVDLARSMLLVVMLAGSAALAAALYRPIGLPGAMAIALGCDTILALGCLLAAARSSEGRELQQLRPASAV